MKEEDNHVACGESTIAVLQINNTSSAKEIEFEDCL